MHRLALSILGMILLVAPAAAQQIDLVFDPSRTSIGFTLEATLHTVHGTFQLVSGRVRYDPATGDASGAIVVDARSGDTGNANRDRDMHGKVLESDTSPTIVFDPERVFGQLPPQGSGDMTVLGSFRLGAGQHPIEIPLSVQVEGNDLEIHAQFELPYVEWGLTDPSKFVLRVAKEVLVTITAHARTNPITDADGS